MGRRENIYMFIFVVERGKNVYMERESVYVFNICCWRRVESCDHFSSVETKYQ